jgi:hypothetical protein
MDDATPEAPSAHGVQPGVIEACVRRLRHRDAVGVRFELHLTLCARRHIRPRRTRDVRAFARFEVTSRQRRGPAAGERSMASAKLVRMSEGFFSSCTAAKACAVRSHDQGAWVWRRRS